MISAMILSNLHKTTSVMRRWVSMAGILFLYHPLSVFADGKLFTDMEAPYESCGYCHEYDGIPPMSNYPKIAGQKKQYIIKQMLDYRSGRREGRGMMDSAAALLSDKDLQTVADFFSKQTPSLDKSTAQGKSYTRARKLWLHGDRQRMINACVLCHEAGDDPEIPHLRGQHADYLAEQMLAFKHGKRTNDEVNIMQFFAQRLSDEEITELSEFIAIGAGKS